MKLSRTHFTYAKPNHDYAYSAEGYIYKIPSGKLCGWCDTIRGGRLNLDEDSCKRILKEQRIVKVDEVNLNEISYASQELLASVMGAGFPWSESSWGSEEAYLEWACPQTLQGKIQKALRVQGSYATELVRSYAMAPYIRYLNESTQEEYLVKYNDKFYRYTRGYDIREGEVIKFVCIDATEATRRIDADKSAKAARKARAEKEEAERQAYLSRCSELGAKYGLAANIVAEIGGNDEAIERYLETLNAKKADQRAYARRCGKLSKQYGVRFAVVLAIGDNEREVADFADTLKAVCKCRCEWSNFTRSEMEALGFHPRHCSDRAVTYVKECLAAGRILA